MSPFPVNSPFKLLNPYEKADVSRYFGRTDETRQLAEALLRSKFMLLYGASGTGKTSLIQCGLQGMFSPRDWLPVLVRRGNNFIESIQEAVLEQYRIRYALRYPEKDVVIPEDLSLRACIQLLFKVSYVPIYLILDQFEEIFTLGDTAEQAAFFRDLEALGLFEEDFFCKLLIVTREEYLAHFYGYEKTLPFLFEYRFRVEKMRREQLLEVVAGTLQGPYEGYPSFQTENGTTEQILDNLTDERGEVDLSTLQVYLDRLYQEDLERQTTQNRDVILFDADLVGANKLHNVLADFLDRQLQTVNRQLQVKDTDNGKNPALQVLFKLVTDQGTKQNHSAKEVFDLLSMGSQGQSVEQVEQMLELLAGPDIRMLNRHRSSKTKEERFELVHDRLAEQVFAKFNADELAQREARTTLKNKEKRSVTTKEYLSKGELELVGRSLNLALLERNLQVFYDQSVAYHIRRERRQRWITFGAVLAAFVFALVAMVAYLQTQIAEVAKSNAESRLRSSQAFQTLPFDPTRAKALADSAYSANPDFYALSALLNVQYRDIYNFRDSLFTNPFYTQLTEHTRKVFGVSFSPDGRFFATTSDDTTLIVWHTATKKLAASCKLEAVSKSISFHPDGTRMVVGMIWPPHHVKVLRFSERTGTISEVWRLPGDTLAIQNVQFSRDGKSLLINYDTGNLAILNAYSYKIQTTIPVRYGRTIKANFSPDGRLIMVSYKDSTVGIWNLNGILQKRLFFNAWIQGMALSEDNKYLFCGQQNGDILILDWQNPTNNLLYQRYEAHSSGISSLNLFHQDHYLLSSSYDGNTIVWEWNSALKSLKRVVTLNCGKNNPINDAAVAPNSNIVVSTAFDKSVYLWQLNDKPLSTLYTDDYLINFGVSPAEARLPFKYACANEYGITLLDSMGVLLKQYFFEDDNKPLSIAISIDGKILAGTRNKKAILFKGVTPL